MAAREVGRRDVLTKGLAVGGLGVAAGLLTTATGAGCASAQQATSVTLDVACLGDTLRIQATEGNEEGDLRGNTFYVEGYVYEDGTIDGEGFDPASVDPIGHWLCRGWFMINADRADPHVITTQEYILDRITSERIFPADSLTSSGTEGTDAGEQPAVRAVIGGTGRYIGATGQVIQHNNGTNTTTLFGIGEPAPNFRFDFTVLVADLQA